MNNKDHLVGKLLHWGLTSSWQPIGWHHNHHHRATCFKIGPNLRNLCFLQVLNLTLWCESLPLQDSTSNCVIRHPYCRICGGSNWKRPSVDCFVQEGAALPSRSNYEIAAPAPSCALCSFTPYLIFVIFSPQTLFWAKFFSSQKRVNCRNRVCDKTA